MRQQEGLSWDKLGISFPRNGTLEDDVGPVSGLHQNVTTTDAVRVFLRPFGGVVDGWTIEVVLAASTSPAGSASLRPCLRGGGTRHQEAG